LTPLETALKARVPDKKGRGCFLCKWILEDLLKNGELTETRKDATGWPTSFTPEAKKNHLRLERIPLDSAP
jgi:hypothetical protein